MLGKLLKQEFRATGRIMLPVFGALVLLSVLANISFRLLDRVDGGFLGFVLGFVVFVFVLGMFGAAVMTLVLLVTRFHRNLLGDEGYLMHTLPVSVHGLIGSKLIVSLVWFLATGLILLLIGFLTGLIQSGTNLKELFLQLPSWKELKALLLGQGVTEADIARFLTQLLAFVVLTTLSTCLHFYSAMAMGHMFNKDKVLLSVVFFVVISFVLSLVTNLLGFRVNDLANLTIDGAAELVLFSRSLLRFLLAAELLKGALLYFATALSLRRGLNLA